MRDLIAHFSPSKELARQPSLEIRPDGAERPYSKSFSMFKPHNARDPLKNGFAKTHSFSMFDPEHRASELGDRLATVPSDSTMRLNSYIRWGGPVPS